MATGTMPRNAYPPGVTKAADADDLRLEGKGDLWDIDLGLIDELISNHRLRKGAAEGEKIAELAKSIDEHGLQQPIRLYHQGQEKGKDVRFTLGFGHRRLEAHKLLGRQRIRAFVFPPAPEHEIHAVQAVENLHREDLHPLEEAEACAALIGPIDGANALEVTERLNGVAAKIGRPRNWVEGRLSLLRLSPRVRQMLLDELIYLGHAQLIARLAGFDAQEDVAGRVCARKFIGYGGFARKGDMRPPESITETRRLVEQHQRTLSDVPWRLDVEFAGKVACASCPENSANAPGLFEDREAPKKVVCLNAACYAEKVKAASSAVQRASNTLVKAITIDGEQKSPTPAAAKKAIAQREVDFVRPAAVTAAAKRKQAPKQPTPAEKRGAKAEKTRNKAQAKFDDALHEWKFDLIERITKLIAADYWRRAMFVLITSTQAWRQHCTWAGRWGKRKKEAKAAVDGLMRFLAKLGEVDEPKRQAMLLDFIGQHGAQLFRGDEGFFGDTIDEAMEVITDERWLEVFPDLAEAMPAKPKLEDFQSAAPAAGKKTNAKKKPWASAGAGGAAKKKARTRRAKSGAAAKKVKP